MIDLSGSNLRGEDLGMRGHTYQLTQELQYVGNFIPLTVR